MSTNLDENRPLACSPHPKPRTVLTRRPAGAPALRHPGYRSHHLRRPRAARPRKWGVDGGPDSAPVDQTCVAGGSVKLSALGRLQWAKIHYFSTFPGTFLVDKLSIKWHDGQWITPAPF
jgi:hypothetical protein